MLVGISIGSKPPVGGTTKECWLLEASTKKRAVWIRLIAAVWSCSQKVFFTTLAESTETGCRDPRRSDIRQTHRRYFDAPRGAFDRIL
jgi:hypothetical protein